MNTNAIPSTVRRRIAMDPRLDFYASYVDRWIPDRHASVLVIAGGQADKQVIESLGFGNVVFSNVDPIHAGAADFAPYKFSHQDAEALTYADASFDYVIVHAGLHHCHSPHRALLEMYRVARKGIVVIEARDSATMRLLQLMMIAETYEVTAVRFWKGERGGVKNGPIPNFVYRWTEREVQKTINCFAPQAVHSFDFGYGRAAPAAVQNPGHSARNLTIGMLFALYRLFALVFPRQRNLFAIFVSKPNLPNDLQPWLRWGDGNPRVILKNE